MSVSSEQRGDFARHDFGRTPSITSRPELRGTFGMIATTHWVATGVGMGMMEKGGNAFDAAAAAGICLQVVEPNQNGPGGDLPVILWNAKNAKVEVLCAQGPAPAKATVAHYKSEGLDLVPGTGLLAAVIPGSVGGWLTLLRDHGTMRLRDVLEPVIHYARTGYPVTPAMATTLAGVADLFKTHYTSSADVFLPGGKVPAVGSLLRNPKLADTFERMLKEGEAAGGGREAQIDGAYRAFYAGFVAEIVGTYCATQAVFDSSGERHKGVLTAADMAGWKPKYEAPLAYDYKGWTVHKTQAWGQGPIALQILGMLDGFDLDRADVYGDEFIHLFVEAVKLAMADREAWYGDPDFVDVPTATLISREYAESRRVQIGERASLDLRPGTIPGRTVKLPNMIGKAIPVLPGVGEPGAVERARAAQGLVAADTVHVSAADRHGNMVSCMPSGGWLQSSPVIPELGFCLGTRAQMFWLEEGLPASLEPGKRPRSTLTPGLATREGKPALAWGSPGGDGQDQWSTLAFLRHVHGKMNLQAAIDAPAVYSIHAPNSFYPREAKPGALQIEDRLPEATQKALEKRGHKLERMGPWSLGRVCAVGREKDGLMKAAANPRFMQNYAAGR
jgi:gamma-glutamyltranspeptidase/glutathione hydrolase